MLEPEPEEEESSESSEDEELALSRDCRWLAATEMPFPPVSPRGLGGLPPLNFPLTSWGEDEEGRADEGGAFTTAHSASSPGQDTAHTLTSHHSLTHTHIPSLPHTHSHPTTPSHTLTSHHSLTHTHIPPLPHTHSHPTTPSHTHLQPFLQLGLLLCRVSSPVL